MVYVCDAIMGTGKTESAIRYMNEHSDKKYIFITPYLEEATRIYEGCRAVKFLEPKQYREFNGSKILHTFDLVRNGCNVATTHQAFRYYPPELLEEIRNQGYTLVIDEDVNVLECVSESTDDIKMLIDAGYIEEIAEDTFRLIKTDYKGTAMRELIDLIRNRDITRVVTNNKESFYYWGLPSELITSFTDTFILSYLFDGQSLHHFLEMHGIAYRKIGVEIDSKGFHFSDSTDYVPEYVSSLPSKIHILEDEKLNAFGNPETALSMSWFNKDDRNVTLMKNALYNFFHNKTSGESAQRLWTTYSEDKHKISGKGFTNRFLAFNTKATNKYRGCNVLAYCANPYMNVGQKLYYQKNGVNVNEDVFALSILVQWIWRSAIRDGKEITVYIPSRRMREMFKKWIDVVSNGGDTNEALAA